MPVAASQGSATACYAGSSKRRESTDDATQLAGAARRFSLNPLRPGPSAKRSTEAGSGPAEKPEAAMGEGITRMTKPTHPPSSQAASSERQKQAGACRAQAQNILPE